MGDVQRQEAKARLIAHLRQGVPWHEATRDATAPVSRRTAYRLLRRVRLEGEGIVRQERRHGHAHKVRGPVRAWLAAACRASPSPSGARLQGALRERFGLTVSVSQINRVRAALGLSRRRGVGEKSGVQPTT